MIASLKKWLMPTLLIAGTGAFIYVAGTSGSCAACSSITGLLGLNPTAEHTDQPLARGQQFPDATVFNEAGEGMRFSELRDGKPAVVIFYRGGWCPICNEQLAALGPFLPRLQASGFDLYAISPDRPELLRGRPAIASLPYTLLSDSAMTLASAAGIAFKLDAELVESYRTDYQIDIEADSGQQHNLLPHPSVFVIDPGGTVRFAHINPDYRQRMSPLAVLQAAQAAALDFR